MLLRLIAGAGLFALGYYLGKQVGRTEPIREELEAARAEREDTDRPTGTAPPEGPRER